jgi:oligopeptidase B|tara:strand:+ start:5993 stop:8062 length:2070 start_codon:yes stop_codon:yes gene_type:complete
MKHPLKKILPPSAKKIPKELKKFDSKRVDNYFWLKNRDDPKVIEYLEKENDYFKKMTSDTEDFQETIYNEIKKKIKEDDQSVPYFLNGYWYLTKYQKNKNYPIYLRRKSDLNSKDQILFDCNLLAEGYEYFNLSNIKISPNNKFAAYSVDTLSRRLYTIRIKNLHTGEVLNDQIINTSGGFAWANDNKTLFYTNRDSDTLRNDKILRHEIGTKSKDDKIVFHEKDNTFYTSVSKSKSNKFIIISSHSTLTSEFQFLDANKPLDNFRLFNQRKRGLEYSINHYEKFFYIITNIDNAKNYKLMKTPIGGTEYENWINVIDHRKDVLIEGIDIFKNYLVISERANGLNRINVRKWDDSESYYLDFKSETFSSYTTTNVDFDTNILRYGFNSLTQPPSIIDFNMSSKKKTIRKQQQVLDDNFKNKNYISERIWSQSEDGTKIPISLVYKKGLIKNNKNPLLLYGYGSYGNTIDPYFSVSRLSLLDRGFVFAIAHVRGSEYMGRKWYDEGKLLKKTNTFKDFITCTKHLISEGYTNTNQTYAYGGSAGGLLMGSVINLEPELYNGVIAAVPFVDVLTTMLDETIPLTTGEYDEWGNPNNEEFYNYILSYSPYDNVKKMKYPNLLVTTGLYDSQVQYWEPAKWVAKLRELKVGENLLLLKTNMDSGHGGASGRFDALKEVAREYVFLFSLENIHN